MNVKLKMMADQAFGPVRPERYGPPGAAPMPFKASGAPDGQMSSFGTEWLMRKTTDGNGI